jgi:hypothetical protein
MVRDGVANLVSRLRERGWGPRRVGHDAWVARCPAHRSLDYALSITRNEFNHVVIQCRSAANCDHTRIVRALGFNNDLLYAETPPSSRKNPRKSQSSENLRKSPASPMNRPCLWLTSRHMVICRPRR